MNAHLPRDIETIVATRMKRRDSTADMQRLRYVNECLYRPLLGRRVDSALYVGVGHGLDVILALLNGFTKRVVGVDPYIADHGNDQMDYKKLMELIRQNELGDRFQIKKMTIEEYLPTSNTKFDLIVCNDVLHHIFWTSELLNRSEFFSDAVNLFRNLANSCCGEGMMVIAEPERHGLRQMLTGLGVLKGSVNYRTKQPRNEWANAAVTGGWSLIWETNYIPWKFRGSRWLWSGFIGRFTLCDKYFLYFGRKSRSEFIQRQ